MGRLLILGANSTNLASVIECPPATDEPLLRKVVSPSCWASFFPQQRTRLFANKAHTWETLIEICTAGIVSLNEIAVSVAKVLVDELKTLFFPN